MKLIGFRARIDAIIHKIFHPTHNLQWRVGADKVCDGDIICETCSLCFWCRVHDLSNEEIDRRLNV